MAEVVLPQTISPPSVSTTEVQDNFEALRDAVNSIDAANLSAALAALLGVTADGTVRRGKSIIAGEGTRTNVAYGALDNGPDQVAGVVVPTDGLLMIGYQATWKESVASSARAAIFIGANQLKRNEQLTSPVVQETQHGNPTTNVYKGLATMPNGLNGSGGSDVNNYTGDVTTGQIITAGNGSGTAGLCAIHAAAGTYTVSVQFKASSGSVTAKERKLWVEARGF